MCDCAVGGCVGDIVGVVSSPADGVSAAEGGGGCLLWCGGDEVIVDVNEGVGCYDSGEKVEQRTISRERRWARVRLWHGGESTCTFLAVKALDPLSRIGERRKEIAMCIAISDNLLSLGGILTGKG